MSDSLHLSFFVPSLAGGGAERIVTTLANALVDRGHQVDLLLPSIEGAFTSAVDPRVSVLDLERRRTWTTTPALARVLHRRRPDVVVTALLSATVTAYAAVRALDAFTQEAPSLCATVHSLPTVVGATVGDLRAQLLLQVARFVLRDISHVVAVSDTVAQDLAHFAGLDTRHIAVIPNPFDVNAIQSAAEEPFYHPWIQDEAPVVVAAGRLSPEKAYPDLLRALSHLRSDRPLHALLLGQGPEQNKLQRLCRELRLDSHIAFLGFLENPYRVIERADLLVLPSPAEAFGNVVVEALACGTPVVATTSSGGPVELVEDLNAGYPPLSPPNPSALARAIDTALTASINEDTLRNRARDFDVSEIANQYVTLFRRAQR